MISDPVFDLIFIDIRKVARNTLEAQRNTKK
jgi:hypothetical protein